MSGFDACAFPPISARVAQVVLVECARGVGSARHGVLQVWSLEGQLLAEHDRIHPDPIYPANFLRDAMVGGGPMRVVASEV